MTLFIRYRFPFITLIVIAAIVLLYGSGCHKETTCNGVPNVSVSFQENLFSGTNVKLSVVGGSEVYGGGYDGVLLYQYAQDQFLAYDCCCPYDGKSNSKAIVAVQSNGIIAACPVCGSTFLLSTGEPEKGPATCPLKAYTATYDQGNNEVYVSN
jgi:nitrite reductase/ring-hydroxylating ferredoxin subunit